MPTETYTVTGMTCSHCVGSVTTEIKELRDVTDVRADLGSGTVAVTSDRPVDKDAAAAVTGAGYELAD